MNFVSTFGCICVVTVLHYVHGEESTNKIFKLSDLPVLKKWEIPNHHFSKHVGRKYKDLDNERKRSAYWELKPEFTANELAWDDDPEKLQLDFNYKSFFADEDDEGVHAVEKSTVAKRKNETTVVARKDNINLVHRASNVTGDKRTVKSKLSVKGHGIKKHLKNHSIKKQTKKHHRSRRSVENREEDHHTSILEDTTGSKQEDHHRSKRSFVEEHDGDEEDKQLAPENIFLENIQDGDEFDDDIRMKRAAIWDAVRRIQMSQGDVKRHSIPKVPVTKRHETPMKHQSVQYPTPVRPVIHAPERSFIPGPSTLSKKSKTEGPNNQEVKNQRNAIAYVNEADIIHKAVKAAIEAKKQYRAGELGDEQSKRNKVKILDKKIISVNAVARQNILKPKESPGLNVDPTNVARAVTMAMEQLKRDKMWGKVFVHVRPSGQLKVMVQETKKMDESK